MYYFAKFGMEGALDFLDMECKINETESDEDDVIDIKINKIQV